MDSRKRVTMEIGVKRPWVPAIKKHRCLRFGRDQAAGFVEKMTTSQMKNLVSQDATSTVRLLGAQVSNDLVDSPQSLIAEIEDYDSIFSRVRKLEADVVHLEQECAGLKHEFAGLKQEGIVVALIVDEGYMVCMRAFADFVVNSFFQAAGNPGERRAWLEGSGALVFVQGGGTLELFGKRMVIDRNLLFIVRKLRMMSKKYSKTSCHNIKPVQVAYALERLAEFTPEDPVVKFFTTCFGVPTENIVKLHNRGKLPAKYLTEYNVTT